MTKTNGSKARIIVLGGLLVAMLSVGLVTAQAKAGGNGNGGSNGKASSSGDVRGSKQEPVDPCENNGSPCGQGDHGQGNPVNGSLHANCHAAQGEVDPLCVTATPQPTEPPTETPTEESTMPPS